MCLAAGGTLAGQAAQTASGGATPAVERARDLGAPFEGTPGPLNAITDVPGVEVGYTTLISENNQLTTGSGAKVAVTDRVVTGITAILPRGKDFHDPVFGGFFSQNGNGEMTGIHWVQESGFLEGPIMITGTDIVGTVRDAVIGWEIEHKGTQYPWSLPVVAETWDGFYNGFHGYTITTPDTWHAIDTAATGPLAEGNVGGGAGMGCFGFKGGSGTASRVVPAAAGGYTVGVFVQCNTGSARELRIGGVAVGQLVNQQNANAEIYGDLRYDMGSIIIVVATNAPVVGAQLDRLARRATLGLGRVGGTSGDGSGDIFVSFSTANRGAAVPPRRLSGADTSTLPKAQLEMMPNWALGPIFDATIQATEEAIINAMVGAKTITGMNGNVRRALPHEDLRRLMKGTYGPTAW
ncbi:MAG: P1 family peptidase [Acidobacteria bacterium]|nr:P1 family peptidase [Acidobacteriota bacterium]